MLIYDHKVLLKFTTVCVPNSGNGTEIYVFMQISVLLGRVRIRTTSDIHRIFTLETVLNVNTITFWRTTYMYGKYWDCLCCIYNSFFSYDLWSVGLVVKDNKKSWMILCSDPLIDSLIFLCFYFGTIKFGLKSKLFKFLTL